MVEQEDEMTADLWSNVELVGYADALVAELSKQGVRVTPRFLVPRGEYRELTSALRRAWLRLRMYVLYPLLLATDFIARPRPDVSVVTTNTFFAPWLASRLASRRRRVVNLVYDLFPEALCVAGKLSPGSWTTRVIEAVTRDTFQRSTANVFLGQRLLEYASAQYGPIPRAAVIPVGAESDAFAKCPPTPRAPDASLQVLYCGNLGWMHDIQTFAKACLMARDERDRQAINIRFCATGHRLRELQRLLTLPPVGQRRSFQNGFTVGMAARVPEAEWRDSMLAADVGLVTMIPGAEAVVMPSKAYSAMVAGQAILAVCPLESDLADLVLKHDCGWVVIPEGAVQITSSRCGTANVFQGAEGLHEAFCRIAADREMLQRKRMNSFLAGHRLFSAAVVADQWHSLFMKITADRGTAVSVSLTD